MGPLIAVPFSRPACSGLVAYTLASQTVQGLPVLIVENGPALGSYPHAPDVMVGASRPSAGAARNAALDYARAAGHDWIVFLDDDDYYGPGYVAQCLREIESERADAYHQGMAFVRFEDGKLFSFGGRDLSYACVIANSLILRVDGAPDFPEISGGEEKIWSKRYRGRVAVSPPWNHVYNRTGFNSWATSRVQMLHTYGPARVMGDAPDAIVDLPHDLTAYPKAYSPTDDRIFKDLERTARRRLRCYA